MIQVLNEKDCCGCGACVAVCPKQCIKMKEGTLGSLFPIVENQNCISCGACERVCPIKSVYSFEEYDQLAFAAYANDKAIRKGGSSGGMFQIFANKIFSYDGIVYGAAFDNELKLKCVAAHTEEDLKPLLKSKYLQSSSYEKFAEIKARLNENKVILFVSTPCQVAALKSYLHKEYKNLITVDFFCHGVPSQKFFDECIEFDERTKYRGKVLNYTFREKKRHGSTPHYYSCDYETNGVIKHCFGYYFDSTFYAAFQKYICLRESCYNCKFYGRKRFSDITIGDFHEIDRYINGINRFDGVSTVIINSTKGGELFNSCKDKLTLYPMDIDRMICDKVCLSACTEKPNQREEFVAVYNRDGIEGVYKKYLNPKFYLKNRIYYGLPFFIRRLIKR